MKQYLLGFDVGSSSVKASLVEVESGLCAATAFYPQSEAPIKSVHSGWAEQSPDDWWQYMKQALAQVMSETGARPEAVQAIGISYQMHGLVCVGRDMKPLRDAIIWCDSRAVPYGERAFRDLGADRCLGHLLNSPGNFTASKLAWVKENEPQVFEKIHKIMLPGDYIALRLSGECNTTASGLSEGMLWDFQENRPAQFLMDYFGFPTDILPQVVPTFSVQSRVSRAAAEELGLKEGTPISYRAGDQPNNALFNTFAHVNHLAPGPQGKGPLTRLGVLLCINGTGILNAWMRRTVAPEGMSYNTMNDLISNVPVGSDGVTVIPFGNGAERVLENRETGCSIHGINFNKHTKAHLLRAAQEGIVFSFCYGMEIMRQMGMDIQKIHAGHANMFLSDIFRQTLASTSGATIELLETDGSVGAAKGAGMGCGIYQDNNEAFASLRRLSIIEPDTAARCADYKEAYERWKERLSALAK